MYSGDKQVLKFILDYMVYIGPEDIDVISVLRAGGDLAAQLGNLMVLPKPTKKRGIPPWTLIIFYNTSSKTSPKIPEEAPSEFELRDDYYGQDK